jgi:hypothetical protein
MDAQAAASNFVGTFQTNVPFLSHEKESHSNKKQDKLLLDAEKGNVPDLRWPSPAIHHSRRRQPVTAYAAQTPADIASPEQRIGMHTPSDTPDASTVISGQKFELIQTGIQSQGAFGNNSQGGFGVQASAGAAQSASNTHISVGINTARALDITQLNDLPEVGEVYSW